MNNKTKSLIIGLIIRLVFAPFTGHPWDVKIWQDVGQRILMGGQNIYTVGIESNWYWGYYAYPPLWMIFCALGAIFSSNLYAMMLVLKLPMIIADVFAAQMIYNVVEERTGNKETATKAYAFYFLNPFVILVGSVWGMFDALPMIFTFVSTIYLYNKKLKESALTLGIGIAFKIYPIFLLPLYLFYMKIKQKNNYFTIFKYLVFAATPTAIASIPFLILDYHSYIYMIFFHAGHIGQLTYWFLLSHELYVIVEYGYLIFIAVFAILYFFVIKEMDKWDGQFKFLNRGTLTVLLAFFITTTKMNDHYFLWCIPYAIVDLFLINDEKSRKILYSLIILLVLYILLTLPINNFFLVSFKYNWRYGIGLYTIALALIVLAPIFPLICARYFQYLVMNKLSELNLKRVTSALAILGIVVLLVGPIPLPIETERPRTIIALPESPAAGFARESEDMAIPTFNDKYPSDIIVLAFAPDFVHTYKNYDADGIVENFFKVRFDEGWVQSDIKELVSLLHDEDKKVLLGVYFIADYVYNFKGYKSQWVTSRHPEILNDNTIVPYSKLNEDDEYGIMEGTNYSSYFTESVLNIVEDFDFDGVAFLRIGKQNSIYTDDEAQGYVQFYCDVADSLHHNGKILVSEDFFGQNQKSIYEEIIPKVDFFIVQSKAWIYGIYFLNSYQSKDYFVNYINSVREELTAEERSKMVFSIETMDEQEGWFVPYFFLKSEIETYSALGLSGYVICHANIVSPFAVSIVTNP